MFAQPFQNISIDSRRIPVVWLAGRTEGKANKRSNLPGEVSSMSTRGELDNLRSPTPEVPAF